MIYFQTGDVLYNMTDLLPKDAREIPGNLIHKGNTNHHIIEGDYQIYDSKGIMYILVKDNSELKHEEHHTIVIPEGLYVKSIVKEYDHFLEESREVVD